MMLLPVRTLLIALGAALVGVTSLRAQTFNIDFGATGTPTTDVGWNNVTTVIGTTSNGTLNNLVNSQGTATSVNFGMLSRFNDSNPNGPTATTTGFPATATQDSLFGNPISFNNITTTPSFRLTNLTLNQSYSFTFYASRTGVTDNRSTDYTVAGSTTQVAVLDPASAAAVNGTVTLTGITPDSSGGVTITLSADAANTNASKLNYIGVLRFTAVPEPGTTMLLLGGASVVGWLGVRRRH